MKIKKMISVVVCVIFLTTIFCQAADKVDLKLRLKAGENHEMKMTQIQNITQTIADQEQKMKQTQEVVIGFNCLSVDAAGNMDVEMIYK